MIVLKVSGDAVVSDVSRAVKVFVNGTVLTISGPYDPAISFDEVINYYIKGLYYGLVFDASALEGVRGRIFAKELIRRLVRDHPQAIRAVAYME